MNEAEKLRLKAAVDRAKQILANRKAPGEEAAALYKKLKVENPSMRVEIPSTNDQALVDEDGIPRAPAQISVNWTWNPEQQTAIDYGVNGQSFNLIGAAGTGKTTTLRGMLKKMLEMHRCPPLEFSTKYLVRGSPGIALVSFTRRAVRNIARQMPDELKGHCITIHKLLEYAPEYYTEWDAEKGYEVNKMRFSPTMTRFNPLPRNLRTIVIDESSMVSIELFDKLVDALPDPMAVQFIFLGDLNQLPPVYGQAILGMKLLQLPVIELTRVYRQALESPIIGIALAVKDANFKIFNKFCEDGTFKVTRLEDDGKPFDARNVKSLTVIEKEGRGKITIRPWKKQFDWEIGVEFLKKQMDRFIATKEYIPDEDLVLCPYNKTIGTIELNKGIANTLGKLRGAVVHEVIAGFQKYYFAVGDKLLVDKQEAIIIDIQRNTKYIGAQPGPASKDLDRWGVYQSNNIEKDDVVTDADVDAMLENLSAIDVEDRTHEASHTVKVRALDGDFEFTLSKAVELNAVTFGYAITVHKAQGSECRRVFFLTHHKHSHMLFRELVYTGITRAAEELYIIQSPQMLDTASKKARIKGNTLEAKLAYFNEKLKERLVEE